MNIRRPRYRIGTEPFFEYVKDIGTYNFYERMIPYEDDLTKEAAYGERIWKSDGVADMEPAELLVTAVVGRAVLDFLEMVVAEEEYYGHRPDVRERRLANMRMTVDFLKESEATEGVYDYLQQLIRTERNLKWILSDVKRCYGRFLNNIGRAGTRTKRMVENGT